MLLNVEPAAALLYKVEAEALWGEVGMSRARLTVPAVGLLRLVNGDARMAT